MKPGYQTTEFWATIVGAALSVLVAFGVASHQDATSLQGAGTDAAVAIVALVVNASKIATYVKARQALKLQASPGQPAAVAAESVRIPPTGGSSTAPPTLSQATNPSGAFRTGEPAPAAEHWGP